MSMPSDLSILSQEEPDADLEAPQDFEDDLQANANEFEAQLDPALSEEEAEAHQWKDSEDDEDEVDQSLSAISQPPQQPAPYLFSPVKTSILHQFATPQPASRSHSRRISMPPAGAADAKPSIRSTLVRLQISNAGERIVHEVARKEEAASADVSRAERSSPSKARRWFEYRTSVCQRLSCQWASMSCRTTKMSKTPTTLPLHSTTCSPPRKRIDR